MADEVKANAENAGEQKQSQQNEQPAEKQGRQRKQRKTKAKEAEAAAAKEAAQSDEAQKEEAERGIKRKTVQKVAEAYLNERLLFGKYPLTGITVTDQSLANYINLTPATFPNTYGRGKNQAYYEAHINIVERLINKLMRGGTGKKVGGKFIRTEGRLQGKKLKAMHIVEDAFDIINENTHKNPVQVFVDALQNVAPIEDTTRVRYGGISYNVAVDVSSNRRLNLALRNIALAAIIGAFKNRKTLVEALANEIMLAANKDPNSYAIKKKVEAERIARSAR